MVTDPFLVGVFFGFVPAMGFLYILLHEYQRLFQEKRIFRTFLFGMIVGVLVTVLEQAISPTVGAIALGDVRSAAGIAGGAVFALLVGLLEAMAFTVVLNWKTFRGRRDTPFYAVSFGLGFGGTKALVLMTLVLRLGQAEGATPFSWIDAILVAMLGLFFVGGILVYGAVGAWIGHGTGVGPLGPMIARAAVTSGIYVGAFYVMFLSDTAWLSHAVAAGGVVGGVVLVARVILRRLDSLVPPEVLREIGIHNRRLARRVLREGPPGGPPGPT